MRSVAFVLSALLVVLALPSAAAAQAPAQTLAELARRDDLKPGQRLTITFVLNENAAPQQFRGDLVSIDETAIRMKMGEDFAGIGTDLEVERFSSDSRSPFADRYTVVEIPEDRVSRIWTIDSLTNGVLIGAAIGAAPMIITAAGACASTGCDDEAAALVVVGVGIGAGIGAGVGALVDYARKREGEVLFEATGTTPSITYTVAPIVSRGRKGALFVIRW